MKVPDSVSRKMELMAFICAMLVVAIHVPSIAEADSELSQTIKFFSVMGCAALPYLTFLSQRVIFWGSRIALQCNKMRKASCLLLALGLLLMWIEASGLYTAVWSHHLAICAVLFAGYVLLPDIRLPDCLRRMSFPIYLLHLFVLRILAMAIHYITKSYAFNRSLAGYFIYWIIGVSLSIVVARLIVDRFKRLSYVCFGGR